MSLLRSGLIYWNPQVNSTIFKNFQKISVYIIVVIYDKKGYIASKVLNEYLVYSCGGGKSTLSSKGRSGKNVGKSLKLLDSEKIVICVHLAFGMVSVPFLFRILDMY